MAVRAYRLAFEDIFIGEISRKINIPVYKTKRDKTATATYMRTWPGWFGLWVLCVAVVFTDVFVGWWYLHCSISNVFWLTAPPPLSKEGELKKVTNIESTFAGTTACMHKHNKGQQ